MLALQLITRLFRSNDLFATLLFGWAAECATSCLLPPLSWAGTDLTNEALNLSGALLAGLASGVAQGHGAVNVALLRLVPLFQGGFVGVWTSFAVMAEHAAEIAYNRQSGGPGIRSGVLYLLANMVGGVGCNWLGFRLGRDTVALGNAAARLSASLWLPRVLAAVTVGCVARALLSLSGLAIFPRGFVSDPTNPAFAGMEEVQSSSRDWKEIGGGLLLTTCAIASGDFIGGWPGYVESLMPWSTLRCNIFALAVVSAAFYIKEARPQLIRNVLFTKLVSSFTGALSAFGGTCNDAVQLLLARQGKVAGLHLAANIGAALLSGGLLLTHHVRYRSLERAASKIARCFRRKSARRMLQPLPSEQLATDTARVEEAAKAQAEAEEAEEAAAACGTAAEEAAAAAADAEFLRLAAVGFGPLQNCLFTPELQWQSRGKVAYLTGVGLSQVKAEAEAEGERRLVEEQAMQQQREMALAEAEAAALAQIERGAAGVAVVMAPVTPAQRKARAVKMASGRRKFRALEKRRQEVEKHTRELRFVPS